MSGLVVGIDPGKTGAAVALDLKGNPIEWMAADHPREGYTVKGTRGRDYVPSVMALWLSQLDDVRMVLVEKQSARPIEGRTSCLTTGYGFGLWVGILAAHRIPYRIVPPGMWTRAALGSVPKTGDRKSRSIVAAAAQVPGLPLTWDRKTKPHDGLADAALIARYGLTLLGRGAA